MKKIGIIGGMSYESSTHYYERINRQVNDRLGALNCAEIIMYSVNFEEIEPLQRAGRWTEIAVILGEVAKKLELVGVDVIVIATNTIHKVFYEIQSCVSIPIMHIADPIAKKCNEQGIYKVGLIGTGYTMKESFLKDRLKSKGVIAVVPDTDEKLNEVNRIVFEELCKGIVLDDSREYYKKIINELIMKYGVEGIILGCTEIEMLISDKDVSVPVFDTTALHIEGIVDYIIFENE